jgi:hypothetical protein
MGPPARPWKREEKKNEKKKNKRLAFYFAGFTLPPLRIAQPVREAPGKPLENSKNEQHASCPLVGEPIQAKRERLQLLF